MKLHHIAINNLRRRKSKALFLLAGLVLGVGSIVALITVLKTLEENITHTMEEYGANILITPRSEGISLTYAGLSLGGVEFEHQELLHEDLSKIKTIENAANIRAVGPKLFGVVENEGGKAVIAGVDHAAEFHLKPWWEVTGDRPSAANEILAGSDAAAALGLSAGEDVVLGNERFVVAGVLHVTGSQDDGLLFLPMASAQRLLGREGRIDMAEVAAHCANCPIEEIVAQLTGALPSAKVVAVQQVVQGRMQALEGLKRISLAIAGIVLLVGALVVFVTMMASVSERTREIGIFSAIGFRRSHIMRIILLEAALVSLAAGIIGYALGLAGSSGLRHLLAEGAQGHQGHGMGLDFTMLGLALGMALSVGLLASIMPAAKAARMDPCNALRTL